MQSFFTYQIDELKDRMIRDESSENLSSPQKAEIIKTNVIVVNKLTVIIVERQGETISIEIEADIQPILDGENEITVNFEMADEPIEFTEDGLRLHKITSVIQKQAYAQYPDLFKSEDPDVIISNYSLVIRKDSETFPDFKDTILDSLYGVFHIDV